MNLFCVCDIISKSVVFGKPHVSVCHRLWISTVHHKYSVLPVSTAAQYVSWFDYLTFSHLQHLSSGNTLSTTSVNTPLLSKYLLLLLLHGSVDRTLDSWGVYPEVVIVNCPCFTVKINCNMQCSHIMALNVRVTEHYDYMLHSLYSWPIQFASLLSYHKFLITCLVSWESRY